MLKIKKILFKRRFDWIQIEKGLSSIRQNVDYLVVSPSSTGANWKGIENASRNLFPEAYLSLPFQYSNSLFSEKDWDKWVSLVVKNGFKKVVFSGFPFVFKNINKQLREADIKTAIWFHGTLTEVVDFDNDTLADILQLGIDNQIDAFALVRKDLIPFFEQYVKCQICNLLPKVPQFIEVKKTHNSDRIKIGVFGGNTFNKNILNQVAGACMVPNSIVYVPNKEKFKRFPFYHQLESIGENLSHELFLEKLGEMDVNLHLSFSESWGQIAVESIARGVICLVSSNSKVFESSNLISKFLTLNNIDDLSEISKLILGVQNEENIDSNELNTLVNKLDELCICLKEEFLKKIN